MCEKKRCRWLKALAGLVLLGGQCAIAQMQRVASPATNHGIPIARPVVMNMRTIQQATRERTSDNNLLITGNVAGGKHFRASVPYTASSALQTTLPSDSLSSFFRLSQVQDHRSFSPMAFTPYYSTTATATYTKAGQSGIITPVTFSQNPVPTSRPDQAQAADTGLTTVNTLAAQETLFQPQGQYTDMGWTTNAPLDPLLMPISGDMGERWHMPLSSMPMDIVMPQDVNVVWTQADGFLPQVVGANDLGLGQPENKSEMAAQDPNTSEAPVAARYFISSKMTMQAYTQTKFNTFMKAGETYLKQGLYDKAEDAYTLASTYRSGHALAVAGKSHALLGKRAYSGSALHLIRALTALPDYAKTDMGLADLVGGFEAVKGHIDRLEACAESKHVPELKLLLAFVHVQMGDVGLAQEVLKNVPPSSSYEVARVSLMEASRMPLEGDLY